MPRRSSPRRASRPTQVAAGENLCVWASRLPNDIDEVRAQRDLPGGHVRVMKCAYTSDEIQDRVPLGAAITLTPLSQRTGELDRVLDEYAADVVAELGAKSSSFAAEDRAWTRRRRAKTSKRSRPR